MDGLSSGGGVIAVVSLAVQLADSVKKVYEFWSSVEGAPEEIHMIAVDLNLISRVLADIALEAQRSGPNHTLTGVLDGCGTAVKTLEILVSAIEPGFASTSRRVRKWTAFTAVLKTGKLKKFQDALQRLKTTLILAERAHYNRLDRVWRDSQQKSLTTVTQLLSDLKLNPSTITATATSSSFSTVSAGIEARLDLSQLPETVSSSGHRPLPGTGPAQSSQEGYNEFSDQTISEHSRTLGWPAQKSSQPVSSDNCSVLATKLWRKELTESTRSDLANLFGFVNIRTTTKVLKACNPDDSISCLQQDQQESEISMRIGPAPWMIKLGINRELRINISNSSICGLKTSIQPFCLVPDDALILRFCREGNTPAVTSLLSRGDASVRDTDSLGRTPLWFAAAGHHPELCKLLISIGADKQARGSGPYTGPNSPASEAASTALKLRRAEIHRGIETLRLFIDSMDYDPGSDGFSTVLELSINLSLLGGDSAAKREILLWLLQTASEDIKSDFVDEAYARLLLWMLRYSGDDVNFLLKLGGKKFIEARRYQNGYTPLQMSISMDPSGLGRVLAYGPNCFAVAFDELHSPKVETPTSLAMYSSWAFGHWRTGLKTLRVDFNDFISQELGQSPLVKAGWNTETLRTLFELDFQPSSDTWNTKCKDCGSQRIGYLRVEPRWQRLLQRIRTRTYSDHTAGNDPEGDEGLRCGNSGESGFQSVVPETAQLEASGGDHGLVDGVATTFPIQPPFGTEFCRYTNRYLTTLPNESPFPYQDGEDVCTNCWAHYQETGHRFSQRNIENDSLDYNDGPFPYRHGEPVCKECWVLYQETGFRYPRTNTEEESSSSGGASDDEYSPFWIHT